MRKVFSSVNKSRKSASSHTPSFSCFHALHFFIYFSRGIYSAALFVFIVYNLHFLTAKHTFIETNANFLWPQPAKIDLNKKSLPKQMTIQNLTFDAHGFRKTKNENPLSRKWELPANQCRPTCQPWVDRPTFVSW